MEHKPEIGIIAGNFDIIHPGYAHIYLASLRNHVNISCILT